MLSAFRSIYDAGLDQSLYNSDFAYDLENVSLRYNVDIIVASPNGAVLITTQSEGGQLLSRMMKRMYSMLFSGKDEEKNQILYSEDNCSIEQFHDSQMKSDFLILWGTLYDGNILFVPSGRYCQETAVRRSGCRMGFHGQYHCIYWRDPAFLSGDHRSVFGKNVSGDKKAAAFYHC